MTAFDLYPPNYRASEIHLILSALSAGECAWVAGLSGAGKSNLLGFLYHRVSAGVDFALADGNRARPKTADGLFVELARALKSTSQEEDDPLSRLESAV